MLHVNDVAIQQQFSADSPLELSCQLHLLKTSSDMLLEERPVIPGVLVKAASINALIELLVKSFLPIGGLEEGNNFPRVMLLMHQWFISSEELAHGLIEKFWKRETTSTCSSSCLHSLEWVTECLVYQYRTRVCHTLRYWINTYPLHFYLNSVLTSILKDFQYCLHTSRYKELAHLIDFSKLPSYDWARNISVRNPATKYTRKVSLLFDHLEPQELAEHLTFLEHKVMRRISFMDFKTYAEKGTLQNNTKLERSISLFNGLSQWIQCMVLSQPLPQQRADAIVKFVAVAKCLHQFQNFNSLMAVVGGLSHSSLARLTCTMACVPLEVKHALSELTVLLSSASNFTNYRRALAERKGFCIPILGVHMKDLISLHAVLPDKVNDNWINFRKIAQLSLIFQELWALQTSKPELTVSLDLVNTLRLSLDMAHTEDELYELSLAREPRSSQHSPSTRPTVFAEWAAGTCNKPDPETLEKHIHAVVEAVFKNYDTDRDGYISRDEFRAVASNFPFIDSFCVLDTNQDNLISKLEMKNYFLRANSMALRTGFQHDFHETTYFKPTFCVHCTGLLWGLIKQGFKCRDCGVNAHKHCKDLMVMECRKDSYLFSSPDGLTLKNRVQRHMRKHSKDCQAHTQSIHDSKQDNDSCHCKKDFLTVDSLKSDHSEVFHEQLQEDQSIGLLSEEACETYNFSSFSCHEIAARPSHSNEKSSPEKAADLLPFHLIS